MEKVMNEMKDLLLQTFYDNSRSLDDFEDKVPDIETDTTNNEKAFLQGAMNKAMARHYLVSMLNSDIKKKYDKSKKSLDELAEELGINAEVKSGDSLPIYQNDNFIFTKKRNSETTQTSLKDFVTELRKLGVEKDILDKAFAHATQFKDGNLYYTVDIAENVNER